ncbi:MAG: hypothetical protein H6827_07750 [Planctomycetes bacterium]|nr:hypothetical protein [Planctomycetota bacterium]
MKVRSTLLPALASAVLLVAGSCSSKDQPAPPTTEQPSTEGTSEAVQPQVLAAFQELASQAKSDLEAYAQGLASEGEAPLDLSDLEFEIADVETIQRVLKGNLQAPLPTNGERQVNEGLVQAISHALVGIYDYAKTKRVYICPTNLENNARLLGITDLNEPDAMYAVMLHEGAHAIADRRFGLRDFLAKAMEHDEDAGLAADAMVEGYAQYVARQICTKTGKLKGLESFTRSISAIPPVADASQRALLELQVSQSTFSYTEGERFVQAVADALGEPGIQQIFATPPKSRTDVAQPSWYLHPETRPQESVDWDPALGLVPGYAVAFPDMHFSLRNLSQPEVEAAVSVLGPAEAKEMAGLVQHARMQVGVTPMGERLFVVGLSSMPDAAGAARYIELSEKSSKLKDEAMKHQGMAQITSSEMKPIDNALGKGFDSTKIVRFQGQELPVRTILVAQDNVVIEVTMSNAVIDDGELMEMIGKVRQRSLGAAEDSAR